jgi:hypothetical protein
LSLGCRIYQTLRVVDYAGTDGSRAEVRPRSLEPAGTFAHQVAAAVERRAGTVRAPPETGAETRGAAMSVEVTGHTTGAALATLYVVENVGLIPPDTDMVSFARHNHC